MNTNLHGETSTNRKSRKRPILALIAAGTVLGLGATAVIANWTDIENALGQFGTGAFGLEGSTLENANPATWSEYASHNTTAGESAAQLNFDLGGENLASIQPDQVLGAKFRVRLVNGTSTTGALSVDPITLGTGELTPYFDVKTIYLGADKATAEAASCGAAEFTNALLADVTGKSVNGDELSNSQTDAASTEGYFCMLVNVKPLNGLVPLPQGVPASAGNTVVWNVKATSGTALAQPIANG